MKLLDHALQTAISKHINPKIKEFVDKTWYPPGSDPSSLVARVVSSAPHRGSPMHQPPRCICNLLPKHAAYTRAETSPRSAHPRAYLAHAAPKPRHTPTPCRVPSQREERANLLAPLESNFQGEKSSLIPICKAFFLAADQGGDSGSASDTEDFELTCDFPSDNVRNHPSLSLEPQRARACGPNPTPSASSRAQHLQTGAQLNDLSIYLIREFELEHDEPTVELCAAGIAFFLAYGWHAEPRIKGKGEASLEGYVRFQDSHLTIGLLPRVLNCARPRISNLRFPSTHLTLCSVPQGCATPSSARQREPHPASHA